MATLGTIVLISGPISSGKSTLANKLNEDWGFCHFHTSEYLKAEFGKNGAQRKTLQDAGEALDRKTNGGWVLDGIEKLLQEGGPSTSVVVDAVRIVKQVEKIRQAFGRRVLHVHVTASQDLLKRRFNKRKRKRKGEPKKYADLLQSATEKKINALGKIADLRIDIGQCTEADVVTRVAARLGLYGRGCERLVDVVVGGEFGSEGKGHIVSYLASEYDYIVRVGGPNAGHTVWEEPIPYTFHCLPSGSRHSQAALVIGPGAVITEDLVLKEIADCQVKYERIAIDPQCMIISQIDVDWEVEHLRDSIGSTAQGVGHATARRILYRHKPPKLAKDCVRLKQYIKPSCEVLERAFAGGARILVEGTQGTGLSLFHGSYPHVTSRDTTVAGCIAEAGISPSRIRRVIMVCRSYPIRVQSPGARGATSGPMSQELTWKEISRRSGIDYSELKRVEKTSTTKRKRRVSEFDWALLRRATSLNAPTDIALTFADYLDVRNRKARRFEQLQDSTIQFIEEIEQVSGAPVSLISTRFHSRSIIDRRNW